MFSKDPHFTPPSRKVEERIDAILAKLSLEEKIDLLGGQPGFGGTKENAAAGIPAFKMSDGPVGVHWFTKSSTTFPALIAVAASWDRDLAYRVGWGIGKDARARGIHILLAPGVNIYRSPLCGRNFEYCGEDPFLAGQTAAAYIRGVQDMGVAATVKHYAVNFQEYDRHNISSDLDERTLHEIYLPAFKAAVKEAGCACLMNAYNLVNGVHCSEHSYLNNAVLKDEWGFDGLVMSDWVSTYSAVGAANGGLDLEMPTAQWLNREKLLPAVREGKVSEAVIDDKIRRLLRVAVCFGWLDRPQEIPGIPMDDPETAQIALDAARGSIVLLKNDGVLPFDRSALRKLAVVGFCAEPANIQGGGSAFNPPNHTVSILQGIKALVGDTVEVTHAAGPLPSREWRTFENCQHQTERGEPGIEAHYFDNPNLEGDPLVTSVESHVHWWWGSGSPAKGITAEHFSVRWTGFITPPRDGTYVFYAHASDGGYRVWLDNHLVLDTWEGGASGTQKAQMHLPGGTPLALRVEYRKTRHWAAMHFGWENADEFQRELDEALAALQGADAAVVCVGFDRHSEGEGFDRTWAMDPQVERLVREASARCLRTVVALHSGGNVDMSKWVNGVKGLVHAWYPGQEAGTAVAEVLFGAVNPSGKLPASFEARIEERSSYDCYHDTDGDKRVALADGIFCGYRHHDKTGVAPRFPFGFGLSYTKFAFDSLKFSAAQIEVDGRLKVSFDIVNRGTVAGAEVAQVYVRDEQSSLPRPAKELKGFAKVFLQPDQRATVTVELGPEAFAYYNPKKHAWVVEPGVFEVLVGASSADVKLRGKVMVGDEEPVRKPAVEKVPVKKPSAPAGPAKKAQAKGVAKLIKKTVKVAKKSAKPVTKPAKAVKAGKRPVKSVKKAATAAKPVKKAAVRKAAKPVKKVAKAVKKSAKPAKKAGVVSAKKRGKSRA